MTKRIRQLTLALLVLTAIGAAHADSLPPPYDAAFEPGSFTQPASDGFWARGLVSGRQMYARYGADMRVVRAIPYSFGSTATPLADGGLFVTSGCSAESLDGAGQQTWRSTPFEYFYSCAPAAIDAAGNTWMTGRCQFGQGACTQAQRIVRLDTRGIVRVDRPVFANSNGEAPGPVAGARIGSGAWLVADGGVSRIAGDGTPRGGWSDTTARVKRIATDPSDRGWAFAIAPTPAQLVVGLLSPTGALANRAAVATVERPYLVDAVADATGAAALVGDATFSTGGFGEPIVTFTALRLHRFDAAGTQAWTRDFTPDQWCLQCAVALGADGDALVLVPRPGTQRTARLLRIAADNTTRSDVDVEGWLSRPATMADGSTLVIRISDDSSVHEFLRFTPAGQPLAAPVTTDATAGQPQWLATHFERSGAAQVLSFDETDPRLIVAGYAADGSLAWRRETNESVVRSISPVGRTEMAGNGRTTCWTALTRLTNNGVSAALVAECVDAATGTRRFRTTVDEFALKEKSFIAVADDDSLTVAYRGSGAPARRARYDANGTLLGRSEMAPYEEPVAINAAGDVLVGDFSPGGLAVFDRDGTLRWTHALPNPDSSSAHALSSDRRATFVRCGPAGCNLVLLDSSGIEQWRAGETDVEVEKRAVFVGNDPLLVRTLRLPESRFARDATRFDAATGAARWNWRGADGYPDDLEVDVDGATGSIAIGTAGEERLRVALLDAESGTVRVDRSLPCANASCRLGAIGADAGGGAHLAEFGEFEYQRPGGSRWRLRAVAAPSAAPRLDQAGLAGAWYPEYAAGQGLFLEWLPGSRAVFSAWFTYASFRGNRPDGLQWYSLQGDVPVGATRATLGLFENRGGVFATPPATTAQRVGSATLALDDCGRASLDYVFDAGSRSGESGRYSLSRLTRPRGCSGAGGAPAPAASGGFEGRHSGAWFTPATSGQGLVLSVEPGATLFGAWFTYDPAGAADDAATQHWFTLQAGIAGATGGRVELPIHSTIGGDFARLPTRNTFRVGTATLTLRSCDRATLEYRFDSTETSGAFAGRTGQLELQRLGGCET